MNSLKTLDFKLINLDLVKTKDNKEFVKIQGIVPLPDKRKEKMLFGDFEICEIFDEYSTDYDELLDKRKTIDIIHFSGYYDNFKFKPVNIIGFDFKKEK